MMGSERQGVQTKSRPWTCITEIIAVPDSPFNPKLADTASQLPHTFASIVNKRHIALQASLLKQPDSHKGNRGQPVKGSRNAPTQTLTKDLVLDALSALQQLHAHYETLLADPSRLQEALSGFDQNSVIWVPQQSQDDFVAFVNALWTRWGDPSVPPGGVKSLVEWAMDPGIDQRLLTAGVDSSVSAYRTIEQAFQLFRAALDDMLQLHSNVVAESNKTNT